MKGQLPTQIVVGRMFSHAKYMEKHPSFRPHWLDMSSLLPHSSEYSSQMLQSGKSINSADVQRT